MHASGTRVPQPQPRKEDQRQRANGQTAGDGGGVPRADTERAVPKNQEQADFQTVRRRTKPKFQTPEIKKTMKVDNRYGVLEAEEENQAPKPEGGDKMEVRSRRVENTEGKSQGRGHPGLSSSSTAPSTSNLASGSVTGMLIPEIIDLTKSKDGKNTKAEITPKLAGEKHLQEDREKRLSSVGAITPEDSEGRKKLKNHQVDTSGGTVRQTAVLSGQASTRDLRKRSIRRRISTSYNEVDIFALQELKTKEFELEANLKLIAQGGRVVVDYRSDGWGGAAVVIKPTLKVVECGVKGDGQVAWATVETSKGPVGVMSVYAPHSEQGHINLWRWVQQKIGSCNWIFGGDLNMVEWGEDTNCVSPLLSGEESYLWQDFKQETCLAECYKGAARRSGPRFTRVQVKGDKVEMSRLDRWYLSKNGAWVDQIAHILHDSKAGISDHCPVILDLRFGEGENNRGYWKTYMKLSVEDLKLADTKKRAVAAWGNHPVNCQDPRLKWDLAWRRIKTVVKEARRQKRATEITREDLEKIHADWRDKVEILDSEQNREGLKVAVEMLREKDIQEARLWKLRSRAKWLSEGDAPSKYFFALWKFKSKQETIRTLQREDGTVVEGRENILKEIGCFYKNLYKEEGETNFAREERSRVLGLIKAQVDQEENARMEAVPLEHEIEECVKTLAKDKAPGLDGVSADVLREMWTEAKTSCKEMLECFWETEQMTASAKKGVIKLIPKNEETSKLTNWRLITLTGITYKLASKILADRLKRLLPRLISGQQTGFVPGRTIFDNILALKLGEEWVTETGQGAMFLKLDFVKAYDRIRHTFLWDTLRALGFSDKVIKLFQGLMTGAEATVHHDGDFTEVFCLERGVRQGCPLAPFLFSLSTEPLMLMLLEAAALKNIEGIKINDDKQLLFSLFADDTGLCLRATEENFRVAKAVVDRFEAISGAQLNVSKSLIIPLGLERVPRWMLMTGCKVAAEGEIWTYLGAPVGVGVAEEQLEAFLIDKLTSKVNFWANRILSWEGRCIVLKHALATMPNYYLMTLGLTANGYKKLDRICWRFLWGTGKDGNFKKSLVSWERICKGKLEGGLGLTTFKDQSMLLKMRLVTRLLDGDTTEWADIAREMLLKGFREGRGRSGIQRSVPEILIQEKAEVSKASRTLSHILKGWNQSKGRLTLKVDSIYPSKSVPLDILIQVGERHTKPKGSGWQEIRRKTKTMGIRTLGELKGRPLRRITAAGRLGFLPDTVTCSFGPNTEALCLLTKWASKATEDGQQITEPACWTWNKLDDEQATWHKEVKVWKDTLIPAYPIREKANASWGLTWDTQKWEVMWKRVWKASIFPRDKLWLWRLLNKSFFTQERGSTMEVTTAVCVRCERATENVEHLFMKCQNTNRRWQTISGLFYNVTRRKIRDSSLPELLEDVTRPQNLAAALLFVSHSRFTWKNRCTEVYEGKKTHTPATVVIQDATNIAANLHKRYSSEYQSVHLKECRDTLGAMKTSLLAASLRRSSAANETTWQKNNDSEQRWRFHTHTRVGPTHCHKILSRKSLLLRLQLCPDSGGAWNES
ncbi:hypothetical protein R1sor_002122 [Riccia sorocarpa]|uniref:Reverse transcriptase domain-containing protein n=1 Tax=Riccia sorocarpa TaxID=122646 RepID=A0ABD3H195_9MARC